MINGKTFKLQCLVCTTKCYGPHTMCDTSTDGQTDELSLVCLLHVSRIFTHLDVTSFRWTATNFWLCKVLISSLCQLTVSPSVPLMGASFSGHIRKICAWLSLPMLDACQRTLTVLKHLRETSIIYYSASWWQWSSPQKANTRKCMCLWHCMCTVNL